MNQQLSFDLDEGSVQTMRIEDLDWNTAQNHFDKYLNEYGYTVGVKNILDLDETGFAEARNNTFGASDSSVLLEVSYSSKNVPMKTINELLYEKANNIWNEEIGKKASVRKGKELEPFIISKAENLLNKHILKPAHMYVNDKGLATNFDGIIFDKNLDPIPFEIKYCTFFAKKNYKWERAVCETDDTITLTVPADIDIKCDNLQDYIIQKAEWYGVPKYYYTQLQQQMLFTNATHGHLAVMNEADWYLYIFTVRRDDKVIKALEDISFVQWLRLKNMKAQLQRKAT
jgi:predicted phage-related endonuclease